MPFCRMAVEMTIVSMFEVIQYTFNAFKGKNKGLRRRHVITYCFPAHRRELNHDWQADERHGQHECPEEGGQRVGVHALGVALDVDEEGGAGEHGQQIQGVRRGQIHKPKGALQGTSTFYCSML